jgi:predicted membrane protein
VKVYVPEDVGVSVSSSAFVTDARVLGEKRDSFLAPVNIASANYETAKKKIHIESACFVGDIKVRLG